MIGTVIIFCSRGKKERRGGWMVVLCNDYSRLGVILQEWDVASVVDPLGEMKSVCGTTGFLSLNYVQR